MYGTRNKLEQQRLFTHRNEHVFIMWEVEDFDAEIQPYIKEYLDREREVMGNRSHDVIVSSLFASQLADLIYTADDPEAFLLATLHHLRNITEGHRERSSKIYELLRSKPLAELLANVDPPEDSGQT